MLGMTGTKFGCGIAQCGACTVHVAGDPVRSCLLPVSAIGSRPVTTPALNLSPEFDASSVKVVALPRKPNPPRYIHLRPIGRPTSRAIRFCVRRVSENARPPASAHVSERYAFGRGRELLRELYRNEVRR